MRMRGTYIGNGKMLVSPIFGGKLIIPSQDLSLSPDLIISGSLEVALTKFLVQNVKPENVVVDVGANIGYFSILFGYLVGSNGKVYSFEANREIYKYLFDNLSINYLHDRTSIYKSAVYSKATSMSFYVSTKFMGNSSINPHSDEYKKNYNDEFEKVEVDAIDLDSVFDDLQQIDFLKIDIEGGEYQAFIGMEKLIISNKIKVLIFELNKGMLQKDWNPFVELLIGLQDNGKHFHTISDEGELSVVDIRILIQQQGYPYVVMT